MSVDESLMCSFHILKPTETKTVAEPGHQRPNTPPRVGGKVKFVVFICLTEKVSGYFDCRIDFSVYDDKNA